MPLNHVVAYIMSSSHVKLGSCQTNHIIQSSCQLWITYQIMSLDHVINHIMSSIQVEFEPFHQMMTRHSVITKVIK